MIHHFKIITYVSFDTSHKDYEGPTDLEDLRQELENEATVQPGDDSGGILVSSIHVEHLE